MKIFDKFLKVLKTDRNTFFTFLLTLITAYFVVDRVCEMIFLCFAGMSTAHWHPLIYTISFACAIFAYVFAVPSKFAKSDNTKIVFFYTICTVLYILFISMVLQGVNRILWFILFSLPNYKYFFMNFSDLIHPAFTSISIYIIVMTSYKLVHWLYVTINDPIFPNNYKDSILDFGGVDISNPSMETGPFSFEVAICKDRTTGKPVNILENRRFETTLIVGPSGTGKTSMVIEPMIARDLEKKFAFTERAKDLAYSALKQGLATLDCPYDKDYINEHFSLSLLKPAEGYEKDYASHMGKMIYSSASDGTPIYRDLGLTYMTPDASSAQNIIDVAKCYHIPTCVIDPFDANSIGLNPFTIDPPLLCALTISLVLKSLYGAQNMTAEIAYMEDVAHQAIQNLVILLKLMYPRLNNGTIPTLEDLLTFFNNFDLVEDMCEELKKDPKLAEEYALQIGYFEQNFYKNSEGRKNMQRYIHFAAAQLDVLLRTASLRPILCNRTNNLDVRAVIESGGVIIITTRATDIGGVAHAGLGRFFFMKMAIATEGRAGTEKSRIPHFYYIDDLDTYFDPLFTDSFTVFRKFKVGTIFSIPNLGSIGGPFSPMAQTLLSNASTKVSFGNNTPEDYAWWEKEFGERREWVINTNYDKGQNKEGTSEYSTNYGSIKWDWKNTMRVAKIQGLKFKACIYKTKDKKGKNLVNYGMVDFLESKYKEDHSSKSYDFGRFNSGNHEKSSDDEGNKKFDVSHINWGDSKGEIDPVQINTTDSKYILDDEDAITYNVVKKNKKNTNN